MINTLYLRFFILFHPKNRFFMFSASECVGPSCFSSRKNKKNRKKKAPQKQYFVILVWSLFESAPMGVVMCLSNFSGGFWSILTPEMLILADFSTSNHQKPKNWAKMANHCAELGGDSWFSWFFTRKSHYGHSYPSSLTQVCFLVYLTSFL